MAQGHPFDNVCFRMINKDIWMSLSLLIDNSFKSSTCPLRKSQRLPYTSHYEYATKMFDLIYVNL